MSWEYIAKWPIKTGEEVTAAHFEDIRKLYYSLYYGIYNTTIPAFYAGVPEWAVDTDFEWGGLCIFEDYLYTYCHPDEDMDDKPRPSPASSNDWTRTARVWVYSDFNPSNACYTVQWAESKEEWILTPAWMQLPAPLNPYVQQVRQVDEDLSYSRIRPLEEKHGYDQSKYVPFMKYYNDSRYQFGFYTEGGLKHIISGVLGVLYMSLSTYTRNYSVQSGDPHENSPVYDEKMGGYQGFMERICDTFNAMHRTDAGFIWEFYDDGEQMPGFAIYERPKPMYARLNDTHYRCNESAYEAILMILGVEYYDWYLTGIVSSMGDIDPVPERIACWRRMPKYTHGWPAEALYVWPGELGLPPYADEDTSVFPARTNDTDITGFQAARNWWKSSVNYNAAIAAANSAVAAADEEVIEAFLKRHTPVQRIWYKDSENPAPVGYALSLHNEEWWWHADAFELNHELLNQVKTVMEKLTTRWLGAGFGLTFDNYISRLLPAPGFLDYEEDWTDARDYGSWGALQFTESVGTSCIIGWGSEHGVSAIVEGRRVPNTQNAPFVFRRTTVDAAELAALFKIGSITFDEIELLLDSIVSTDIFIKVLVGGDPNFRENPKPSDTDTVAYNIPMISAGSIETAQIQSDPYGPVIPQWVHFEHSQEDREYMLRVEEQWAGIFTKEPPNATVWNSFWGEWDPTSGESVLNARIALGAIGAEVGVTIDPHKCLLRNYLMDDCKTPIE